MKSGDTHMGRAAAMTSAAKGAPISQAAIDPAIAAVTVVTGIPASINLSDLNGVNGFVINGVGRGDASGYSVSSAGDVNGDGYDDLIIGARFADTNGSINVGASYVIFGSADGFPSALDLSSLDGNNGFVINGISRGDNSGRSVSSAGDVNGDGYDDLIIGAPSADPNGFESAGESYVIFGAADGFPTALELSSLDGSNGFVINGVGVGNLSGEAVSSAGDVNGDGYDDLIIGASLAAPYGASRAGESYVIFGAADGFPAALDLSSLNGSNGFVINGIDERDQSGVSVSSAGDVNGDGYDDLIIGARLADPNGVDEAGESYVVFGKADGFGAALELSSLDGSNGFVIYGVDKFDRSGASVSSAGDVNGDGYDDLIIGAPEADPNGRREAGESYVIFGTADGFPAALDLSSLNGSNGFVINGVDGVDRSGVSVSSAGDVNGDGYDDLIVGAWLADPNGTRDAGASYVIFGAADGFPAALDLSSLDGSNGFVISGVGRDDESGFSVSSAGDVNGDGYDDLIIGARRADPNGTRGAGESYVLFGGPALLIAPLVVKGGAGDDTLVGGTLRDTIVGGDGNDSITADDGNDIVWAGAADTGNDTIFGGNGDDTLAGGNGQDVIFGGVDQDLIFSGAGDDDAEGGDGNDVVFGGAGDDTLAGGDGLDKLWGGAGNDILAGNAGNDTLRGNAGADSITGGDGDDLVWAGATDQGNDTIIGGNGDDTIGAAAGNDAIDGGDGNDVIFSGTGNDDAQGGACHDIVFGGAGADTLSGDAGQDTLWGGDGSDIVSGGTGADLLRGNDGDDSVTGGDDDDIVWAGATDQGNDTIIGGNGDDTLGAGGGDDAIDGGDGNDVIFGGAGNDDARGGNGDDLIFGGTGDDTLSGGSGNDELWGGAGNDTLSGGGGGDTFVFGQATGADVITDFEDGIDLLNLSPLGIAFDDLTIEQIGSDARISDGDDLTITLLGVAAVDITADDFVF